MKLFFIFFISISLFSEVRRWKDQMFYIDENSIIIDWRYIPVIGNGIKTYYEVRSIWLDPTEPIYKTLTTNSIDHFEIKRPKSGHYAYGVRRCIYRNEIAECDKWYDSTEMYCCTIRGLSMDGWQFRIYWKMAKPGPIIIE